MYLVKVQKTISLFCGCYSDAEAVSDVKRSAEQVYPRVDLHCAVKHSAETKLNSAAQTRLHSLEQLRPGSSGRSALDLPRTHKNPTTCEEAQTYSE